MKKELDDALVRDFPGLYADRNADLRQSSMAWGFDCGDGWEPIIRQLSMILEPLGVKATQVKEKFGGLSFYVGACPHKGHEAIEAAEKESYTVCEDCGQPGKPRDDSWIRTLCDEHAMIWAARR